MLNRPLEFPQKSQSVDYILTNVLILSVALTYVIFNNNKMQKTEVVTIFFFVCLCLPRYKTEIHFIPMNKKTKTAQLVVMIRVKVERLHFFLCVCTSFELSLMCHRPQKKKMN